jgi:hypothetical protein
MRTLGLVAVCVLVLAGCKSAPPEKPTTPPPSKTATPTVQQPESALKWTPARDEPVDLLGRAKTPAFGTPEPLPMPGSRDLAKGTGPVGFPKAVKTAAKSKAKKPAAKVAAKTGKKPSTLTASATSKSASAKAKTATAAKTAKKPKKKTPTTDI